MTSLSFLLFHPVSVVSFSLCLYLLLNILLPSDLLGGYGLIQWSWHPVLMSFAFLWLMPIGLLNQRIAYIHHRLMSNSSTSIVPIRSFQRTIHSLAMGLGFLCIGLGYYIAFDIHASKGKVHIPFHKGWIRTLHVLFGISVVIFLLYQCIIGIGQYFLNLRRILLSTTVGRYMAMIHTDYGHYFWYGGLVTYILGLFIMFVQNNSSWGNFILCSILILFQLYIVQRSIVLYNDNHSDEYLRYLLHLNFLSLLNALVWDTNGNRGNTSSVSSSFSALSSSTVPVTIVGSVGHGGASIRSSNPEIYPSIDPEKERLTNNVASVTEMSHSNEKNEENSTRNGLIRTNEPQERKQL